VIGPKTLLTAVTGHITPQECQKEHLLLKERRSLIEKGTERRYIKLRTIPCILTTSFTAK